MAERMTTAEKTEVLKGLLLNFGSVAVAFSGGVDSTLLLVYAKEILGERVVALTGRSALFPKREMEEAEEFCKKNKIRQIVVDFALEDLAGVSNNPPERCYLCKKSIFSQLKSVCQKEGITVLADGTNADDEKDYRPGRKALAELGIRSPLSEANMTKEEIRAELRRRNLSIWQKPAYACLATRIPWKEAITLQKLQSIERAEEALHKLGLLQVRVRHHGQVARIEVLPEDRKWFFDEAFMDEVNRIIIDSGFRFAALDLAGYSMGNMNVAEK